MDTYNVMLSIQIVTIALFFGLFYISKILRKNTARIDHILYLTLFGMICGLVAIVAVYTFSKGFGL